MQCLSPLSIPRPGGCGSADRITVPCGKCASCLNRNRNGWSFRLEQEFRANRSAFFLTLTYDDERITLNENGLPSVSKRDVQLFLKRLRKSCSEFSIRYYITAEYGPRTLRPHYHGIIYGLDCTPSKATSIVLDTWQHGHVLVGTVTSSSIAYCTKYCITKYNTPEGRTPVFSLMSTRPGLGASYLDTHRDFHDDPERSYGVMPGGTKVALPRYYTDRLWSPETREHKKSILRPILDHEDFHRNNPSKNPFRYENELKNDYHRRLMDRIDKLNKL